ncbi:MAG: hypothetical protein AAF688_10465 [Bacteroidota bacterium]
MNFKKKMVVMVFAVLVALGTLVYNIATKTTSDTLTAEVHWNTTSGELLQKISGNNADELNDYLEKAIVITGELENVSKINGEKTLLLKNDGFKAKILCELQKNQSDEVAILKVGDTLKIKGIYKGHLLDAILLNCIILERNQP